MHAVEVCESDRSLRNPSPNKRFVKTLSRFPLFFDPSSYIAACEHHEWTDAGHVPPPFAKL